LWKRSTGLLELNMPEWKEEVRKRLSGLNLAPTREAEIIEELG
jgi:hypothetical protein